jgi:hypothetical protein
MTSQLLHNTSNMFSCIFDIEILLLSIMTLYIDIQDTGFALCILIEEAKTNKFVVTYFNFHRNYGRSLCPCSSCA